MKCYTVEDTECKEERCCLYPCDCAKAYHDGYDQGAKDMELAKQYIIDALMLQISKLEKQIINRPTVLYAIEDCINGNIIFNARGGCYRDKADATDKVSRLTKEKGGKYRIVEYRLD